MRNLTLLIVVVLILIPGCGLRLGKQTAAQQGERLAIERGRLSELTSPVDRTKAHIAISHILLAFASDAARERDTDDLNALIDQYTTAIQTARDTMVQSNLNPEHRSEGYRDLELALRAETRLLQDISVKLPADEREPLDRARKVAMAIHVEMLGLMSPLGKRTDLLK